MGPTFDLSGPFPPRSFSVRRFRWGSPFRQGVSLLDVRRRTAKRSSASKPNSTTFDFGALALSFRPGGFWFSSAMPFWIRQNAKIGSAGPGEGMTHSGNNRRVEKALRCALKESSLLQAASRLAGGAWKLVEAG